MKEKDNNQESSKKLSPKLFFKTKSTISNVFNQMNELRDLSKINKNVDSLNSLNNDPVLFSKDNL